MAHRIWKETKHEPGTVGPGNILGCCLVCFHFLWAVLSTSTVYVLHLWPGQEVTILVSPDLTFGEKVNILDLSKYCLARDDL